MSALHFIMNYMHYVYKNAQKCTKCTIAMIHVCNLNRIQVMNYVYLDHRQGDCLNLIGY